MTKKLESNDDHKKTPTDSSEALRRDAHPESHTGTQDSTKKGSQPPTADHPSKMAEQSRLIEQGVLPHTTVDHGGHNQDSVELRSRGHVHPRQGPPDGGLKVLPSSKPEDPSKPTVAVLDGFTKDEREKFRNGNETPAHGEMTSAAAEGNGYNVIRIQTPGGQTPISTMLNGLNDKIEKGEVKLGKGDYVNLSLGAQDPTFKQMSDMAGFKVTAENLKQNREKLLKNFDELSRDPRAPKEAREMAKEWVDSNKAIDKLQARGITVVHASGNDGKDKFSPEFMKANVQLSSNRPDGTRDAFSAQHSLTTPADGFVGFHAVPFNPLSPESAARQKGEWEMIGSKARFPNTGEHSMANLGTERQIFDREKLTVDLKAHDPLRGIKAPMDPVRVPTSMLSPESSASPDSKFSKTGPAPVGDGDLGASKTPGLEPTGRQHFTKLKMHKEKLLITDEPSDDKNPRVGMITAGTSFSNIDYLARERLRLTGKQ